MPASPLWLAYRTVAEGLSANQGLQMARQAGLGVRRGTWLQMVGQVRAHYARRITELGAPLNRRPTPTEVTQLTSGKAKGYIQYVDLFVRNKTTGLVSVRPQAIRGTTLRSRQAVVDRVVSRYQTAVDRSKTAPAMWGTDPDEEVIGGIYTATQQFVPE
jgi:hypothetical protein